MTRKCPTCGFYMLTDSPRCSGCGELMPEKDSSKPASTSTSRPVPMSSKSAAPPAPPPPIKDPGSTSSPLAPSTAGSGNYSPTPPYQPNRSTTSPVPYVPPPVLAVPYPLPAHLARLSMPRAEGEVIDTLMLQNEERGIKAGDVARTALGLAIMPFSFSSGALIISGGMGKPKTVRSVPVFRLKTPHNDIVEVRIERDVREGSIRMGDYVTAFGRITGGTLILMQGFNHTSKTEIKLFK